MKRLQCEVLLLLCVIHLSDGRRAHVSKLLAEVQQSSGHEAGSAVNPLGALARPPVAVRPAFVVQSSANLQPNAQSHRLQPVVRSSQTGAPQAHFPEQMTRRGALLAGVAAAGSLALTRDAKAEEGIADKLLNLPPEKIAQIVREDLVDRQFLATAKFTRAIYDESATFTDEIDTYTLPKFIKGTSALFVPERSSVRLVGDVAADTEVVSLRFDEDLCFNIPFQPIVTVTGKLVLTRDPKTGLITKYREYWDQTPLEVVLTAFNRP